MTGEEVESMTTYKTGEQVLEPWELVAIRFLLVVVVVFLVMFNMICLENSKNVYF